jgi:ABC-type transporter Mla maintaining outer membrane lipid asymmetry permease subunit MlaE
MGTSDPGGFGVIASLFPWFFGAVVVIILCGWVLTAVTAVRNRRVLREAGIDPSTAVSQLAVRLIRGAGPAAPAAPSASASSRLAELGDLRDRGLITAEEYDTRRAQIIAGI